MLTPREKRLLYEFQQVRTLQTPYSLFEIICGRLTPAESTEFLKAGMSPEVIADGLKSEFLPPAEFERRYPGLPPEKYGVRYRCTGMGDKSTESSEHMMEVVFSLKYPSEAPIFVWLTPIWHPNFRRPYICVQGRPFAVGLTLAQIILEVGRMVQYQNYNLADPLNWEAAEWVRTNPRPFPVDNRDLRDWRNIVGPRRVSAPADGALVELVGEGGTGTMEGGALLELLPEEP